MSYLLKGGNRKEFMVNMVVGRGFDLTLNGPRGRFLGLYTIRSNVFSVELGGWVPVYGGAEEKVYI